MNERRTTPMLPTRLSRMTFVTGFLLLTIVSLPSQLASRTTLNNQSTSQAEQADSETKLLEVGHASKLQAVVQKPVALKVVCYNIRWRGGDELRKLIGFLKDDQEIGSAAILGLQEVDRNKKRTLNVNTAKLIAEELGLYYAWTAPPATERDAEEETGVVILSSYSLSDVRRIVLPHEGPGGRRRVAIGATVVVAKTPLRIYSVHLETRIPLEKKIEQMDAVLADLATYAANTPAIVMGDLNTWEPSAVKKTQELFTKANFTTPFDSETPTFFRNVLVFPVELKLDWIWLRGLEASKHGIDKSVSVSDHWPLWAVISLAKRG
jgi:endonuclease/exonuclease/phosphatase family metal-dependent hydrolase